MAARKKPPVPEASGAQPPTAPATAAPAPAARKRRKNTANAAATADENRASAPGAQPGAPAGAPARKPRSPKTKADAPKAPQEAISEPAAAEDSATATPPARPVPVRAPRKPRARTPRIETMPAAMEQPTLFAGSDLPPAALAAEAPSPPTSGWQTTAPVAKVEAAGAASVAESPRGDTDAPGPRAIIVFDFDGTLVRGDCGDRFLRWLLRRNPLRWLAALLLAPLALPLLSITATRRWAVSLFLWLATVGIGEDRLAGLAARFIEAYRLLPIRSAVEALREEVSRGHRVVVATGALRVLADGLLRRLEVRDGIDLVASDIQRYAGGWVVRWQCNGQAKLQRLQAEGFERPYLRAYSDHYSDRWLLAAAGTPVLVNASARHRQRLRAQFGHKLRIVLWQ